MDFHLAISVHHTLLFFLKQVQCHESADVDLVIADSFYELVIAFELSLFDFQKMDAVVLDNPCYNRLNGFSKKADWCQMTLVSLRIVPNHSFHKEQVVRVLLHIQVEILGERLFSFLEFKLSCEVTTNMGI